MIHYVMHQMIDISHDLLSHAASIEFTGRIILWESLLDRTVKSHLSDFNVQSHNDFTEDFLILYKIKT